jgi:hypothetical protein
LFYCILPVVQENKYTSAVISVLQRDVSLFQWLAIFLEHSYTPAGIGIILMDVLCFIVEHKYTSEVINILERSSFQ